MHRFNSIQMKRFCGRRPAVSFLKEQGRGGVLGGKEPEISAYIAPFGPVVLWMIPQPTGIRWRSSGTSPSLGARRLNSLDPFLSHDLCKTKDSKIHVIDEADFLTFREVHP